MRSSFHARTEEVIDGINQALRESAPDPDEVDWPTADDAQADESDDVLFDSRRSYLGQIDWYKRHQRKPTGDIMRRESADDSSNDPGH